MFSCMLSYITETSFTETRLSKGGIDMPTGARMAGYKGQKKKKGGGRKK
jgi:hypothetical protein